MDGSRGRYGETDANSDLTIDFGFFKPMSIGNRVFYDDGGTNGNLNNGVMDGDEEPIENVRVELYRDDGDDIFDAGDTRVHWDITDSEGYYLFDNLSPRYKYFVHIPPGNFNADFDHDSDAGTAALTYGALQGWYSSTLEDAESSGTDVNDNGVNNKHPEVNGITSGIIELTWDGEPDTETQFSGDITNPNDGTEDDNDPTTWDGPESRGRWNESDDNSNLTVDFGFIPPLSLGNRVWIDDGTDNSADAGFVLSQFNNGIMDGDEVGREDVVLNLYFDANGDGDYDDTVDGVDESDVYRTTTTDADGYYLFDGLPEGKFKVEIAASNFSGGALDGHQSSTDAEQAAPPAEDGEDMDDNGIDPTSPGDAVFSDTFTLSYDGEPQDDDDISGDTTTYGANGIGRFGEVDASSNLTLDFGFVQTHSIGNIVWRDADNSGTINGPDDTNPGIAGVTVHLYADSNIDGAPDDLDGNGFDPVSDALVTTTTDVEGYYLFDNLPAGNYIVGIPASNFAGGAELEGLRSSTGTPSDATYTNPADNNPTNGEDDKQDHGIDPASPTDAVYSATITLKEDATEDEEHNETDFSTDTSTYGPNSIGNYNETDATSDITVDFGFFGGTDNSFSIGNQLWFDDGLDNSNNPAGSINDGVRDSNEKPVVGARVELFRDGNGNNKPDTLEYMRFDVTDSNGFYLFDNLDPGNYFVVVVAENFGDALFDPDGPTNPLPEATPVLQGWFSSQPTGTELVGVNNGTNTADIDNDDNGENVNKPESVGVTSGVITLTYDSTDISYPEPSGEAPVNSGGTDLGLSHNPTAWDGTNGYGRFNEIESTSNMTVDFGFIPPMSIGNRVWIDDGAGESTFGAGYNNGELDGTETGVENVEVYLYQGTTLLDTTTTDSNGYYLFDRVQPGSNYTVLVTADNFSASGPLEHYQSSTGSPPADDDNDILDDGVDDATYLTNGISSSTFTMSYDDEPTDENDLPVPGDREHADNVGPYGQEDDDSNLSIDFGFFRPRSLGNRLWFDTNNDGQINAGEQPVSGWCGCQPLSG